MISSIKTPGVYINEIDGFPPSIAQVATAIPAFVGYTEKGPKTPTKVRSLLEYEETFGGTAKPENITIDVGSDKYDVTESKFKLYNSLRLFYSNGGGECYIVSIDTYKSNPTFSSQTTFIDSIKLLEKFDEPTLILFPDAVNLTATNLGLVQQQALMQCADLMDRFSIMDVKQENDLDSDSAAFRDAVGNQNLKYGASYYPYLKANFGYKFRLKHIQDGGVNFNALYSSDATILSLLVDFAILDDDINNSITGILKSWSDEFDANDKVTPVTDQSHVTNYVTNIWNLLTVLGTPGFSNSGLTDFINTVIPVSLKPIAQKLVDFESKYDDLTTDGAIDVGYTTIYDTIDGNFTSEWKDGVNFANSGAKPFDKLLTSNPDSGDDTAEYAKIISQLNKLHTQVVTTMDAIMNSIKDYELKIENDLVSQMPIYQSIISELSKNMNTVPPSGAIAGIYANTDATRGVWKAPANVSVNGIIELTDDINHKEQETMNIHETGKSINAIRKFTGKGLLVWGARTLDGNSNDWRYINVRRLANMIEESAKKATMNFVFEPNVKQTWVNVKGMIENYLTTLWNDGALAGAKPEDAFFVSVGLNATMTANDINEGRMIVKIGYAPSRPAEFIILEFTQTQQKS